MTTDNGGAPCVHRGVLSLALCKPIIRKKASIGSLIFGFGGKRLGGRLIYAARVTGKPELGEEDYYHDPRFRHRPDCIYRDVNGKPRRIAGAKFHWQSDQTKKDVGPRFQNAHVLISKNFRYFGGDGTTQYRETCPALVKMLDRFTQGHRVNHDPAVRKELRRLAKTFWKNFPPNKPDRPSDADKSRRCNSESPSARCPA
jgi:hypothetical protein